MFCCLKVMSSSSKFWRFWWLLEVDDSKTSICLREAIWSSSVCLRAVNSFSFSPCSSWSSWTTVLKALSLELDSLIYCLATSSSLLMVSATLEDSRSWILILDWTKLASKFFRELIRLLFSSLKRLIYWANWNLWPSSSLKASSCSSLGFERSALCSFSFNASISLAFYCLRIWTWRATFSKS
jgi:hypothetical protein